MPITETPDGAVVITGAGSIDLARLIIHKARLKLEIAGIGFKGRTSYSILKAELRLKGNRRAVLAQVETLLETYRANPGTQEVQ